MSVPSCLVQKEGLSDQAYFAMMQRIIGANDQRVKMFISAQLFKYAVIRTSVHSQIIRLVFPLTAFEEMEEMSEFGYSLMREYLVGAVTFVHSLSRDGFRVFEEMLWKSWISGISPVQEGFLIDLVIILSSELDPSVSLHWAKNILFPMCEILEVSNPVFQKTSRLVRMWCGCSPVLHSLTSLFPLLGSQESKGNEADVLFKSIYLPIPVSKASLPLIRRHIQECTKIWYVSTHPHSFLIRKSAYIEEQFDKDDERLNFSAFCLFYFPLASIESFLAASRRHIPALMREIQELRDLTVSLLLFMESLEPSVKNAINNYPEFVDGVKETSKVIVRVLKLVGGAKGNQVKNVFEKWIQSDKYFRGFPVFEIVSWLCDLKVSFDTKKVGLIGQRELKK